MASSQGSTSPTQHGGRDVGTLQCQAPEGRRAVWEETYAAVLCNLDFLRGKSSPCVDWHPTRHVRVVCHGEDFTALGCKADVDWYERRLEDAFELGAKVRMGEGQPDAKDARILNRVLRLDSQGLRFETDLRHIDNNQRSLNLSSRTPISTPGVKLPLQGGGERI